MLTQVVMHSQLPRFIIANFLAYFTLLLNTVLLLLISTHGANNVTVLFLNLDLLLTIQKSSLDVDSDHIIEVYFPPVSLDGKSACLQMNFTGFTYFAVKLAYYITDKYKERMLFRSMESLGKEFRRWETTITPDMTEEEEFVVLLHAQSSSLGTMAIINDINLQLANCIRTGEMIMSIIFHEILS